MSIDEYREMLQVISNALNNAGFNTLDFFILILACSIIFSFFIHAFSAFFEFFIRTLVSFMKKGRKKDENCNR